MWRRAIISFLAAFLSAAVMMLLYVILPLYLSAQFSQQPDIKLFGKSLPRLIIPQPNPTPTPSPSPRLAPATMIIPRLNIQTAVEHVGLTPTNNMDVPRNTKNVAWYMYGIPPGEIGNAIIAGHYDTVTGAPAIFYNLKKLEQGDEVKIISENAIYSTFIVTGKATIPYNQFPKEEFFISKKGKNLNLITCGGIWDWKNKIYSDRIVVYTTLKDSSIPLLH